MRRAAENNLFFDELFLPRFLPKFWPKMSFFSKTDFLTWPDFAFFELARVENIPQGWFRNVYETFIFLGFWPFQPGRMPPHFTQKYFFMLNFAGADFLIFVSLEFFTFEKNYNKNQHR